MNILILGGTGQVGFELQRSLAPLGTIIAPSRSDLDLMSEQAVSEYLQSHKPDLIANAAAWTAVDAAEKSQEAAYRLNGGLPEQLARYAVEKGARLVHYSSDYVYSGAGNTPWTEDSPTGPLSVYGQSKLAGDEAIQKSGADHLIFRTSWVYSARGHNFMKTMLRLAQEKESLNIVADQIGAPTPARLIADVTALAVHKDLESGLYHLTTTGQTSWHGFALEIFKLARQMGQVLTLQAENVKAISTSDYPTPAQRPLNSRLSVTKVEHKLNVRLPNWQLQLELTLAELLK